jgi:hypothetical protein
MEAARDILNGARDNGLLSAEALADDTLPVHIPEVCVCMYGWIVLIYAYVYGPRSILIVQMKGVLSAEALADDACLCVYLRFVCMYLVWSTGHFQ